MVASSVAAVDAVRAAAVVSSSHAVPKAVRLSRAINRLAATAKPAGEGQRRRRPRKPANPQ